MEEETLDSWFKREVLPHEAALLRYLYRAWPRRDDVHDLCQESYARVYEAAMTSRPRAVRAFLFTTAYHLMTDRVRRERVVSIKAVGDIEALGLPVDEISAERRTSATQELEKLAAAFDRLPPRCREVMWLRRVEELPLRQIAGRLCIDVKTVEKHISNGGRLLTQWLLGEDAPGGEAGKGAAREDGRRELQDELQHDEHERR